MLVKEFIEKLKTLDPESTVYAEINGDIYSLLFIKSHEDIALVFGDFHCPYEERNDTKSFNYDNDWKEV